MIPLPYLSVARFQGPEAGEFLQTQLSADIAALEPGDATFACYCSPRGQVIGLLLVCRQGDGYLVGASAELMPRMLTRLKMFVFRSRVEFSAQPETGVFGIGPQEDSSGPGVFQPGGSGLHYFLSESTGDPDGRSGLFKKQEIRNHLVWLGPETTETFIPQMLGFDRIGAVSFAKGCYPGQEIVARARYLGKVKRKPVVVHSQEKLPVKPADSVELHREGSWSKGTVIDAVQDAGQGTVCFIVAAGEPGSPVDQLKYADQSYRCATI